MPITLHLSFVSLSISVQSPLGAIYKIFFSNYEEGVFMRYLVFLLVLIVFNYGYAEIIYVPDDYSTIQTAINASTDNDTILVSPGTYYENIDYSGKTIMVASLYLLE